MLDWYGVPLLVTTDEGFVVLGSGDEVTAMVQQQAEEMRRALYDHSDVLDFESSVLNAVTARCTGSFSRRRSDGTEIGRLTATYLVTGTSDSRRISALAVHSS